MTFFDYALIAVNLLALVVPSLIFRLIAKQDKAQNKFLSDELETAQDQIKWLTKIGEEFMEADQKNEVKLSTTWHAHQIVKKGKQVICLTAIVEASDGPGAVAAFEAQMKEVKAKMRIRSKAPVFAKPVFPNI